MAEYISSMQNPVVKLLKSLHSKKGRYENGLFLVEGTRLCSEICPPWQTEFLIFSEKFYEENAEKEALIAECPDAKVRSCRRKFLRRYPIRSIRRECWRQSGCGSLT